MHFKASRCFYTVHVHVWSVRNCQRSFYFCFLFIWFSQQKCMELINNMVNSEYYEKYREIADILVDRIGYQRKWIKCGRSRPVPAKKVIFSAAVDTIDDMEGWNRQNRKTCATSSRWPIKDEFMCRWQTESWYVIRAATYKKARLDIDIRESTLSISNKQVQPQKHQRTMKTTTTVAITKSESLPKSWRRRECSSTHSCSTVTRKPGT